MNPKLIAVMALWKKKKKKTSFRSCFKLGTHSTMLWLYDHIIRSSFHLRNKTRTKIAYEYKAKRKLKQTKLKFSNDKTTKEKLQQKQLFELFYFFANRNK
jgi:hypothetical protein